jgi:hypothetical protein
MSDYRNTDDDGEWDDDGLEDGDDTEDSGDEPTVRCPYCRREFAEDSLRCPYCERYISEEDHAGRRQPLWVIVTAVICLGVAIWWAFRA